MLAAATLFERASALLPVNDPRWLEVQPELAEALIDTGPLARAGVVLGEAIEVARRVGDEEVEARALLAQASLTSQTDPAHDMARLRVETERLIGVFERLGDDRSLAHAWRQLGKFRMWLGASEAGAEALSRALVFAGFFSPIPSGRSRPKKDCSAQMRSGSIRTAASRSRQWRSSSWPR
jgi:hypothetical protein